MEDKLLLKGIPLWDFLPFLLYFIQSGIKAWFCFPYLWILISISEFEVIMSVSVVAAVWVADQCAPFCYLVIFFWTLTLNRSVCAEFFNSFVIMLSVPLGVGVVTVVVSLYSSFFTEPFKVWMPWFPRVSEPITRLEEREERQVRLRDSGIK